ncbi:hypothetical protein [Solibacillus cecembensis]|uniref:hypothetical protein n=1 Tax=Solibacillus cecembensis TaxID=459347 RepID=UPI000AB81D24
MKRTLWMVGFILSITYTIAFFNALIWHNYFSKPFFFGGIIAIFLLIFSFFF